MIQTCSSMDQDNYFISFEEAIAHNFVTESSRKLLITRNCVENRGDIISVSQSSIVLIDTTFRGKRSEVAPNSSSESYTSGSGSSIESWEEESYIEIMDEVTGRIFRIILSHRIIKSECFPSFNLISYC